ncbi:hypothetical protein CKO15_11650 [Halorhodospira abdelmalekii]|uniref:SLAC1 anion channel family protein n=1 Tax=Halorhodospira abdelmalekii TaxID=421629 RepID=UPI0019085C88|nr:SLAC1 anion channel family protein [Halorhodospira abdelmalekii]MBK1735920.1 hypothetical protein [Halorhodospira abdelmalekii]
MMSESHPETPTAVSLAYLPLPLFAGTMGLSGLALVWLQADMQWGIGATMATVIAWLALFAFLAMALAYSIKAWRYRTAVVNEITHPVRLNFLPTISISLILLGMLAPSGSVSLLLWGSGAGLHLLFMLGIVTSWLRRQLELSTLNPAWFIPAVGNVLVPIPAAHAGYVELAWFFFAVGLFFWLILMTLCYYRLIFGPNLPDFLQPTLAILLAPPAVAYVAWVALNGGALPEGDVLGRLLFYKALFTFLLLMVQVPRLLRIAFYPSWWAYTFPLAAFSLACLNYVPAQIPQATLWIVPVLGLTTLVVAIVFVRTLIGLFNGSLLRPE